MSIGDSDEFSIQISIGNYRATMSGIKNYFKKEMHWRMLLLEHQKPADFYLSVWQTNRSATPLLLCRTLLFISSLIIVLSSFIIYCLKGWSGYWFIYLTHWGLSVNVIATGFATAVSTRVYLKGPLCGEFNLPWYVKTYWVLENIAVPVAFLITIFYWTILFEAGIQEEPNYALDVAVHGLNSVIMFLLLISSSHPSRLAHVYQSLVFTLAYMLFSVIYYAAGGIDYEGNAYIYPVLNWKTPGSTIGLVFITGLLLLLLHMATVGLAVIRDIVASSCIKPSVIHNVEEGVPLRQPKTNVSSYN